MSLFLLLVHPLETHSKTNTFNINDTDNKCLYPKDSADGKFDDCYN